MPFPPEFKYDDEEQFIHKFLSPLLQRLGFSLVVNYHGHAEFGKDLIFAELDRFGHVRYHGLQAKYKASISLNEVDELIKDCKQAFVNPFTHPQTGSEERISSFYAVNGGSLGTEAVEHFFNSLLPLYGGNVRLLQAKDLLTLDRWAASSRMESVTSIINGMLIELTHNQIDVSPAMKNAINKIIDTGAPSWMPFRFRTSSLSSYLQQPILQNILDVKLVLQYCHVASACNWEMDYVGQGILSTKARGSFATVLLQHLEELDADGKPIRAAINEVFKTLGPLNAL